MSKYSKTLTVSTDKSNFKINFFDVLLPNKEYEIGLLAFSTYNNIHNITKDNNMFRYTIEKEGYDRYYPIRPGAYELEEIFTEIKNRNGGYFTKHDPSGKVYMHLPDHYQIDFSHGDSFHELLGFEKKLYYGIKYLAAENMPKIRQVQTINIACDLLDKDNILYSFPANSVPARAKIDERMNPPFYLPITKKTFDSINMKILDQDGNLINFNGAEINLFLHLKEI